MNYPRWRTFGNVVDVSSMFTGVCVSVLYPFVEHSVVIWSMYKHNDKLSVMRIAISLDFYYLVLGAIEYFI